MIRDAAKQRMQDVMSGVEEVDAQSVSQGGLDDWTVVDVREADEYAQGHLPGAVSLPRSRMEMLLTQTDALDRNPDKPVLVYCASGKRSLLAARTLEELGVKRPVSMAGGIQAWSQGGGPIEQD